MDFGASHVQDAANARVTRTLVHPILGGIFFPICNFELFSSLVK